MKLLTVQDQVRPWVFAYVNMGTKLVSHCQLPVVALGVASPGLDPSHLSSLPVPSKSLTGLSVQATHPIVSILTHCLFVTHRAERGHPLL